MLASAAGEAGLKRALEQALDDRLGDYHAQPQPELGNLSPSQVHRLLMADPLDPDSPLRLRDDLPPEALDGSRLFHNIRVLLHFVADHDGLPLTQAGNLRTQFVRELAQAMRLVGFEVGYAPGRTRLTESDLRTLYYTRALAEGVGLLKRRKATVQLTRKGRALMSDAAAPKLFALLFLTSIRNPNFGFPVQVGEEWHELRHQMPFTLYALAGPADDWTDAATLMRAALLPHALQQAPGHRFAGLARILFELRVLHLLTDYGLLEMREVGSGLAARHEYRRAPMYHEVLTFDV
jgi:hypothetical protein